MSDINVISGGAMRRFLTEALPLFEAATGHQISIQFGLTRDMQAAIEAGAAFDLALLPRSAIDALVRADKIAAGTATDIVRSLVGVMVRTGAAEPDIGSVDFSRRCCATRRQFRTAKARAASTWPSFCSAWG